MTIEQKRISPLISPDELLELEKAEKIILIDARAGADAKNKYTQLHLAKALFVDLEHQLASKKENAANGGRHPLPEIKQFIKVVNELGISPESHVVVYDEKNGSNAAARFWWMMKSIGHKNIQVLDGGFLKAAEAGYPVSSAIENTVTVYTYKTEQWLLPLADMQEVKAASINNDKLIIDVRDEERFNGETEPIDLIAGHIPNAFNIPFTTNLNSEGFFVSPDELKRKYLSAFNGKPSTEIIIHCGSGVTACHTLLAIDYAGLEIPNLFVGSWSEWSRNNLPMIVKSK